MALFSGNPCRFSNQHVKLTFGNDSCKWLNTRQCSFSDDFHTIDRIARWSSAHGRMTAPKWIWSSIVISRSLTWTPMWNRTNGRSSAIVHHAIRKNMVSDRGFDGSRVIDVHFRVDCCPEIYVDLKFYINLERRGGFYNYILILPCVLLSCLTCILFWLPVRKPYDRGEKIAIILILF